MEKYIGGSLPNELIKFISIYFYNKSVLPNDYYYIYELNRIKVHSKFRYLHEVTEKQSLMLISGLVLVRTLICKLLNEKIYEISLN